MVAWHGYKPWLCSRLSQVRSGHYVCIQTDKAIAAFPLQKGHMIKDSYREQDSLTNVLLEAMPFQGTFLKDVTIDTDFSCYLFYRSFAHFTR